MKLTPRQYAEFIKNYFTLRQFGNQRVGQAFCNEYNIDDNYNLFYERDRTTALEIITLNHVDWGD
jgi:hypothetical protein